MSNHELSDIWPEGSVEIQETHKSDASDPWNKPNYGVDQFGVLTEDGIVDKIAELCVENDLPPISRDRIFQSDGTLHPSICSVLLSEGYSLHTGYTVSDDDCFGTSSVFTPII